MMVLLYINSLADCSSFLVSIFLLVCGVVLDNQQQILSLVCTQPQAALVAFCRGYGGRDT